MNAFVGALVQLLNVIKEVINRAIGGVDFLLYFVGFQPTKKLRLRVVVLRDEQGQPLVDSVAVASAVDEATRVFEQGARVRVIPAEPLMVIMETDAPTSALDVHCDDGAWQDDFGQAGAYFRRAIAKNAAGTLVGYGAPVTVFIVREISLKGGCSLGPLTDYVTQESRTVSANRLMAHEVAHACGLWHSKETENLMYPRKPGAQLAKWQAAVLRNSRHITYL